MRLCWFEQRRARRASLDPAGRDAARRCKTIEQALVSSPSLLKYPRSRRPACRRRRGSGSVRTGTPAKRALRRRHSLVLDHVLEIMRAFVRRMRRWLPYVEARRANRHRCTDVQFALPQPVAGRRESSPRLRRSGLSRTGESEASQSSARIGVSGSFSRADGQLESHRRILRRFPRARATAPIPVDDATFR